MRVNGAFWQGKRVFITGHTGFKGSWLSLWLHSLGAQVSGFALEPPTNPSLFEILNLKEKISSTIQDVRNLEALREAILRTEPEIVFHLAAQSLVRDSYRIPAETYAVNVLGTVHLLEAVRQFSLQHPQRLRAVINVTTDKVYENKEWCWGYRENDRLGGFDPYSNSKACSELATDAYCSSFFPRDRYPEHGVALASARAGNVIGGGDWAVDRLIPDCVRAILAEEEIILRNPSAVRPWQHVLEPLGGYLLLAEKLYTSGTAFAEGWNFGPAESEMHTVETVVKCLCENWGYQRGYRVETSAQPHEAMTLKLDCSKAAARLGWRPHWGLDKAIGAIVKWTKVYRDGGAIEELSLQQINDYTTS